MRATDEPPEGEVMDRPYSFSDERGLVYVIKHEHDYAKIGESVKPKHRMKELQTGTPYRLNLFTMIDVIGDARYVEQALHRVYEEHRIRGEWFDIPEEVFVALANINVIYEGVVCGVDERTPTKHLELDDEEREKIRQSYRKSNRDSESDPAKNIEEFADMVDSGDFPEENLHDENPAIKARAKKSEMPIRMFLDKVKKKL